MELRVDRKKVEIILARKCRTIQKSGNYTCVIQQSRINEKQQS